MILNLDPEFIKASDLLDGVVHVSDKNSVADEQFSGAEGLVVRLGTVLDAGFLSRFGNLRFVATVTTGHDHIDEDYCRRRGVKVISLRGETLFLESIHATPEHTWGLLLALIRRVPWAYDSVKDGNWKRTDFFGRELFEKCLGVIGFGRVGKIVAQYALAFGMSVIAFDKVEFDGKAFGVLRVPLEQLLREADVISVHLPLTEETRRFLGPEQFSMMKDDAVVINTSRGEVLDEAALLSALERQGIGGAALDVLTGENLPGHISAVHPLVAYARLNDNLLLSPHIAGSTRESMEKTAFFIAEKVRAFLENR